MPATKCLLFKRYVRIELNMWRHTLCEAVIMVIMVLIILLNPIAHSKHLLYSPKHHQDEQSIESNKLEDLEILT